MSAAPTILPEDDDGAQRVERLAAWFVERTSAGECPDLDAMLSTLSDAGEREALQQLVADAVDVLSLLPAHVTPGQILSQRYRIVREIGAGGMGKVFEARDERLQRRVAVKVLAAFGSGAFDPEAQFEKEALALARLSHPNIVPVHEVGRDGDVHYIVMDLVQGVSLAWAIARLREHDDGLPRRGDALLSVLAKQPDARSPLATRDWSACAASLALDVARAVAAAHAAGLVHRDLKPQNVMLRADGTPVVLDFGLAGAADVPGGPITRGLYGSVAYLAPEQAARGAVGADPRTDVYQVGALLYELLTLERVYPGDAVTDLLLRIAEGDFPRPRALRRDVPWALEAVCLKALQRDPERRYPDMAALCADLQLVLEGRRLPVAARGGPFAGVLRDVRFALRRRRAAVTAASFAACAALLLVLARRPEPQQVVGLRWRPGPDPAASTALPDLGEDIREVLPGDVLGVRLLNDEPTWVYAVSVWGPSAAPTRIAPMVSRVVRDPSRTGSLWDAVAGADDEPHGDDATSVGERDRFGVQVEAGQSLLLCTQVGPARADVDYEGLWVYTSRRRQPDLELWMTSLYEAQRAAPDPGDAVGVSMARARELFDAPDLAAWDGTPRGELLDLSDVAVANLANRLSAAAVLAAEPDPGADPRRVDLLWPVGR